MIEVVLDEGLEECFSLPDDIDRAVLSACRVAGLTAGSTPDLCIRFAPDSAVQELNHQWRGKDKVTDVLSFPMQEGPSYDLDQPLGDIALAVPFIQHEAMRLNLPQSAHALHLIIHATLHLLGYDHIDDEDADRMQSLEKKAMATLGLHEPYPLDVSDTEMT
ncbi:probable rRNA maturation factor [Mariprofundus micogutta]|uniref:Endoribonuclease YbeY n=1 Tax=Mariprofundus micogutta TaxID=1921010 RepID=A0A1L8CMC7_9PROT|nr:probable rRNA maturation factor [Mariprofundus micogutta]